MSGRLEPFKQAQDYLPRLKAVFFARWDEDKGCEITYQVPENSIRVASTAPYHPQESYEDVQDDQIQTQSNQQLHSISHLLEQSDTYSNLGQVHESHSDFLFEFTDVLDFILPKKHLCGHLVTTSSGSAKILGFPTLIEDEEKYERNFFMFNLCFVFDKDSELLGYEPIARKTGRVLRSLEQKHSLLSTPNNSTFEIKSILEELYEELNSFSEVSIAINRHPAPSPKQRDRDPSSDQDHHEEKKLDSTVSSTSALFLLNLKLFPFYGNPPKVEDWDVPISLVSFLKLRSEISWDLTMFKLVPFIDGTATVRKISRLADVDIVLTRECIQHLVFSNSYALVGGRMLDLLGDSNDFESIKLQEELKDYILVKPPSPSQQTSANQESDQHSSHFNPLHHVDHNRDVDELLLFNNDLDQDYHSSHSISNLLRLYNEFKSGTTVHDWMEQNQVHKLNIDVRRFISFGTIKDFLKRLNCYPIWMLHPDLCDQSANEQSEEYQQEPSSNSQTYSSHRQSSHDAHERSTSSGSPQPAWLTVLKRLNHHHPLLSPNLSSSLNKLSSPPLNNHQQQNQVLQQNVEDDPLSKLMRTPTTKTTTTRLSNQNQKTYISHLRKPSTFVGPSNQTNSSTNQQRQQPNQSTFQYQNQHESIAVQVPQDLPLKLNGSHHVDELCVEFRISFIQLEQILRYIDTLSLLEISNSNLSSVDLIDSAMHTIYY